MSVIENVKTAMQAHTTYGMADAIFRTKKYWQQEAEITARAKELLEVVHLSGKEDLEADNLPYGEQRRLEIARALATDMKLLLLDEPAAGMNPTETEELLEIITWKQLGLYLNPIVILNINHYYDPLLELLRNAMNENFMRPQHAKMWAVADTPEEAIRLIHAEPKWDASLRKIAAI